MSCRIDHITITSPTLAMGCAWVKERLNVQLQQGGEHPRMGTHNRLLKLGESVFLEVIAINPASAEIRRPRWFELDRLTSKSTPRLACWVVRTDDIYQSLVDASEELGSAESMSRGSLEWLISISADGSLPMSGIAPAIIQWQAASHPAQAMEDHAFRLVVIELLHPEPERVNKMLLGLDVAEPEIPLSVRKSSVPQILAHISTPSGLRIIGNA